MHMRQILGILIFAFLNLASAQAQQLCPGIQFQDFGLYIYEDGRRCWTDVTYSGIGEGTIDLNRDFSGPKHKRRGTAQFLVAIEKASGYETGVVVKERMFHPREMLVDQGKPRDPRATDQVSLERPAVSNRCGTRAALSGAASVSLNVYNRYHSSEYIRMSGDLIDFHYSYPRSPSGCRDTNDFASGNRSQFAFSGLITTGTLMSGFGIVSSAHGANPSYRRLKARNLFVPARQNSNSRFTLIPFQTSAQEFTRSEFTIVDLGSRDNFGSHWPKTWQIEWVP
ncbi:MAG: hypothetical protein IAE80_00340 [Anaerolinea sp.]|nr:hypothetical protein [Anaerolinea sp.]